MAKEKKSHFSAGMLIGATLGAAATAFFKSKPGQELTKELQKSVKTIQQKVTAELKKKGEITEDRYRELVDKVTAYYVATKELAQTQVPAVKKTLLDSWKTIEHELKAVQKPAVKKSPAKKK